MRVIQSLFLCSFMLFSTLACAEWTAEIDTNLFYTNDIGLFSVTRKLSLLEDPTQPVVDRPQQGNDFVYEPNAVLSYESNNPLGEFDFRLDAGGYVFVDEHEFTHGFYQLQFGQHIHEALEFRLFYDYVPDLFIGVNDLISGEIEEHEDDIELFDERLDSHIWATHINYELSDNLSVRLLGRFGLRQYKRPFKHRDTQLWTLGTHVEWQFFPGCELMLGYHYERGRTDHDRNSELQDDVSYNNHYVSAELIFPLYQRLSAALIVDYEHNVFTSDFHDDIHHNAIENNVQGEIELFYTLNADARLTLGWQFGNRKFNFENDSVNNHNAWLGFEYEFAL